MINRKMDGDAYRAKLGEHLIESSVGLKLWDGGTKQRWNGLDQRCLTSALLVLDGFLL